MYERFPITITREGRFFVARCYAPEVTSQGESLEEARCNVVEAIELYIESFGRPDGRADETYVTTVEVRVGA
jgi:predicted RNase H-like HicB family nuclease